MPIIRVKDRLLISWALASPPHLRDLFMDRPEAGMSGWVAPPGMGS